VYKHKSKRRWHAGKPKKKPDYNPASVTGEILEAVVNLYERLDEHGKHPSLQAIVDELAYQKALDLGENARKE